VAIVTDMDAVIADVQAAIDGLDETTHQPDVAIAIKAGLEKDRWFLSAHLAATAATPDAPGAARASAASGHR
jgi:starvation-inducible DNA-binding protein